ncbi:MAG: FAD-dependent oxidoreductase [Phycisphaerae bacterium]
MAAIIEEHEENMKAEKLTRRRVLQLAGAGALAEASSPVLAQGEHLATRPTSKPTAYDVIVCGGGTSGLPAAIAAARQGARVAIIERYGFLGGNAAFSIMPCWHELSGHHSGLLTAFANRVESFGVGPAPLKEGNHIEPEVVKILFLSLALEHGIDLHLHHFLTGATTDAGRLTGVITESKSGRRVFRAKAFVDATGDGDLGFLANAKYVKGENGRMQAMSLRFRVGYIDFDRFAEWADGQQDYELDGLVRAVRAGGGRQHGRAFYFNSRLDRIYDKFRNKYPDLPSGITYFNCSSIRPFELSINTTRVYDVDGTNADDLTRAEIVTRKQAWAVWRLLKDNIPGFANSVIVETAPQVGVRETRSVVGDQTLTVADGQANREREDSVQTVRVTFDSHDKHKYETGGNRGLVDVPYGCFLPQGVEGLLAVGRCTSCDHLMASAFRRMESCFQSGEVGGTAAALAAEGGITPRQLSVRDLKAELRRHGFMTSQADRR